MADLELLLKSIPEIGVLYRSGELSPLELTQFTLERIEKLNPTLNAFITITHERALERATRAEQELRSGLDRGPLHGIPVALKDLVNTAGIRTTCGSRILNGNVPTQDAIIVKRLEAAGAVLVGKTNLLEFAYGIVHPDYGQTNNPFDPGSPGNPGRTAGGSSGGSAAAVAAGLCFAALGTDTGGSIRIPASYCGLAGLKPTYGLTSLEGVFPLSWSLDHAGPIARSSRDARIFLEAVSGVRLDHRLELSGMRFGILQRDGPEMQPDVLAAFDQACNVLERAGAELLEVNVPDLELADAALLNVLLPEASAIHARWLETCPEDYAPFTRMQIELGFAIPAVTHVRAQQFRRHLTQQFLNVLEGVDAILSPTVAFVAPFEDPVFAADDLGATEARRTGPYNLTGLPALTVNCGFGQHGLPVGLQIVTRPHADALALTIGSALEALMPEARAIPAMAQA
jgi:aspartyl-tRNA(Asn)/glutamyl-tRNA(Gln) amidotransferase subunit A